MFIHFGINTFTDVVKAVSDACKKFGLQFAIHYSLRDRQRYQTEKLRFRVLKAMAPPSLYQLS